MKSTIKPGDKQELNPSQKQYEDDFSAFEEAAARPNTAADTAAQDQRDAALRELALQEEQPAQTSKPAGTKNYQQTLGDIEQANQQATADIPYESGKKAEASEPLLARLKNSVNRRTVVAGGASIGAVGLIFALMSAAQTYQPLHYAKILENLGFGPGNNTTKSRLVDSYRFLRSPKNPELRRLDFIGTRRVNKVEAEWAKKGLTPVYDRGRLMRLDVNPNNLATLRVSGLGQEIVFENGTHSIPIDPDGTSASQARSRLKAVNSVVKSLDAKVGPLAARSLRVKAGVSFAHVPPRRTAQNAAQRLRDWNENRRNTAEGRAQGGRVTSERTSTNEDGTTTTDVDSAEFDGDIDSARSSVQRAAGGVAIAGIFCAGYALATDVGNIREANVQLPEMRLAARSISIGYQTAFGDVTAEDIGLFYNELYDESAPEGEKSWYDSQPIKAATGEEITGPDIKPSAHPTGANSSIVDFVQSIPAGTAQAIEQTCGVVSNQIVGWAFDFATGGFASIITGQLQEIGIGLVLDELVERLTGNEINVDAKGAEKSAQETYGSILAGNEDMLGNGARDLSETEAAELRDWHESQELAYFKQKSLFSRLFSPSETKSPLAMALMKLPATKSPTTMARYAFSGSMTGALNNPQELLAATTTPAHAITINRTYSFNVPIAGFSREEMNDRRFEDPYANSATIGPKLQNYKERIEKCFGLDLTADGSLKPIAGATVGVDRKPADNCSSKAEEWTRVRFYVLDTRLAEAEACYQGFKDSCGNIGFTTNSGSGNINASLPGVECPANLEAHPTRTGYYKMPEAPNGEYSFNGGTPESQRWGSQQLVCATYSVALAYAEAMEGKSKVIVHDLNATGHESHNTGVALDVSAGGELAAANHTDSRQGTYDTAATILLGKLFIDTGALKNIWWCEPSDGSLGALIEYAQNKGTPFVGAKCLSGHKNHFHIDLKDEYDLEFWEPS